MYSYLYKKYIEWGNYYRNVDNQYGSTLYPEIDEKRVFITQSKMVETDQPSLSTCSSMTPQRNESCTSSSSSS